MKYQSPRTLFQSKVNSILKQESNHSELFENIFKMQQFISFERNNKSNISQEQWVTLLELYSLLGPTLFAQVVSIIKGKTISFPSEEDYQDSIMTTLCYFYKEVQGLSWDEIKEKLNEPNLNAIKFGVRVRQLKGFIDNQIFKGLSIKERKY